MKLYFIVEHPNLILQLKNNDTVVDELRWQDKNDVSTTLLANVDALIKKHNMKISDLEAVEAETEQASFTSARIARTVAKTINYCLGVDK